MNALNNTTTYEYNYLNKLTKTVSPVDERNSEVVNEYDKLGNLVKTTQKLDNNKNSVTVNKYNAMGLLDKVILSDGTANGEKNITKYFYNNAGIQTKMYTGMSSENDNTYLTTEYEYDSFMRLVRTTDSTGYNSGTITYDLNGNVLTSTDANGNITTNTYDALNRVIKEALIKSRLTALRVIYLQIFRHITQKLLDIRQYACVVFMQSDEKSDCASDAQDLISASLNLRR